MLLTSQNTLDKKNLNSDILCRSVTLHVTLLQRMSEETWQFGIEEEARPWGGIFKSSAKLRIDWSVKDRVRRAQREQIGGSRRKAATNKANRTTEGGERTADREHCVRG